MEINKIFFIITALLFNLVILQTSFSQMPRIEIDEERALYKNNKVKTLIITGQNGYKRVTEIDRDGKKMKSNDFCNNMEANITNYVYDSFERLMEESYYGYESGDGYSTTYYYDEEGNVESTITGGGDENKTFYRYESHGMQYIY